MPKILGIDYGMVRTGLAITDDLQIIASPLQTVPTKELISTLQKIIEKEKISIVVLGEARARQEDLEDDGSKIMPLLLHGDASMFQGSVR